MKFFDKFIQRKNKLHSFLCIGLDPDESKLPNVMQNSSEPLFEFCKEIIDATCDEAVCFKPNIAFFERRGSKGFLEFEKVIRHLKINHSKIPIIADVKRGDLANTSKEYAKYYFDDLGVDSITLSPYMGKDTVEPFLNHSRGYVFLLCLTSNPSSDDFQKKIIQGEKIFLYEKVALFSEKLNGEFKNQVGIVVGGTHPDELGALRECCPNLVFLIPGFGAQGGALDEILLKSGQNSIINSSRSIIFSSNGKDFAESAQKKAKEINLEMKKFCLQ